MVDFNTIITSFLSSGPGWTLVGAILFIARNIWVWLWDENINPQTGKMKGPGARAVLAYELTQEEMRNSIKTTAINVANGVITDAKKDVTLASIESSIKNIEDQLTKINKNEQSVSTQRVMKIMITTILDIAQSAGIDVTVHRSKFIAFLQDTVYELPQIKQG